MIATRVINRVFRFGVTNFLSVRPTSTCTHEAAVVTCPEEKTCNKKRRSLWQYLRGKMAVEEEARPEKPPVECCKAKYYDDDKKDADLSMFGGEAYRTCGRGYIVQKGGLKDFTPPMTPEDKAVRNIEIHPDLKNMKDDPLQTISSVPQRMVEMSDRGLHPLYQKFRNTARSTSHYLQRKCTEYKTFTGPVRIEDLPINIKFNKELLDKKNIYSEFKRVEPPFQLIGRLIEMKRNERPNFGEKLLPSPIAPVKVKKKRQWVFETLQQSK